jgi:hypothetical protein
MRRKKINKNCMHILCYKADIRAVVVGMVTQPAALIAGIERMYTIIVFMGRKEGKIEKITNPN